jgi:hypothetical protein
MLLFFVIMFHLFFFHSTKTKEKIPTYHVEIIFYYSISMILFIHHQQNKQKRHKPWLITRKRNTFQCQYDVFINTNRIGMCRR